MKAKHILFFFLLTLLLASLQVTAQIRYVSHTGSSTYPYTSWETAADSIQKAINASNHGDTIIVANGVYRETLAIHKQVFLLGSSMDSTIIDGRGLDGIVNVHITVEIFAENVFIENFTIWGKSMDVLATIMRSTGYNFKIHNCKLRNARYSGIVVSDCDFEAKNLIIINVSIGYHLACFITDCQQVIENNTINIITTDNSADAYGVHNNWRGSPTITNNIILYTGNRRLSNGIKLTRYNTSIVKNNLISGFRNYLLLASNDFVSTTIIENNTLIYQDYSDWNSEALTLLSFGNSIIRNNIIGYSRTGIRTGQGGAEIDYNLYWQNEVNVSGTAVMGENDIIADPMFVKDTLPWTPEADFHLQAYSPAIDAGDPDILDVDGSRSDIGMFGGPGGTSYLYLDLAPRTPRNFTLTYDSLFAAVHFKWNMNTERDFSHYNIYRDTVSGFSISEANKVFETDTTVYSEIFPSMQDVRYYYRITALDSQMNESQPGEELSVIISSSKEPELEVINQYRLYQNYPNPFNPSTRISYSLKERGYVKVNVYSITGELIENLVNENQEAGYYEVEFNAEVRSQKSGVRSGIASGIYLYRIEVIGEGRIPQYSDMKKMVLVK